MTTRPDNPVLDQQRSKQDIDDTDLLVIMAAVASFAVGLMLGAAIKVVLVGLIELVKVARS